MRQARLMTRYRLNPSLTGLEMAPFTKNMSEVRTLSVISHKDKTGITSVEDDVYTLEAQVDRDYLVAVVPNGGYLVALVVQACNIVQSTTTLPDPLHLSTQFIGGSAPGLCTITIKRIKQGRNYCNLTAELSQAGRANLHCQLIYGILPVANHPFGPFPPGPSYLTHQHPHALSRRCPIVTHPSKCIATRFKRPYTFSKHILQAVDPYYATLLESRGHGYAVTSPVDLGGGGSVWAAWFQMKTEEDTASTPLVSFLADISPDFLPEILSNQRGPMWVPTLALSLDFKHHAPANPTPGIAPRTVGVFFTSKFLIEGRHDATCEVWTAPCEIGNGVEEEGWQDRMFCMVSATQSALTVPPAANFKHAKGKGDASKL